MKEVIKSSTPLWLRHKVKRLLYKLRVNAIFKYDLKRYSSNFAYGDSNDSQSNIEAHVIFYTHQIEKGLSHVEFRKGFGKKALKGLADNLKKLHDRESIVHKAGVSALKEYIKIHEDTSFNISEHKDIIGEHLIKETQLQISGLSGYIVISEEDKKYNELKNYEQLFLNRYSVREYSDSQVDLSKIYEAIEISQKLLQSCK